MKVSFIELNGRNIAYEICKWTKKTINENRFSKEVIFENSNYFKIRFKANKNDIEEIEITDNYMGYFLILIGRFYFDTNKYKKMGCPKEHSDFHFTFNDLVDIDVNEFLNVVTKLIKERQPKINILFEHDVSREILVVRVNIAFSRNEFILIVFEKLDEIINMGINMKLFTLDDTIREVSLKIDKAIDPQTFKKMKDMISSIINFSF